MDEKRTLYRYNLLSYRVMQFFFIIVILGTGIVTSLLYIDEKNSIENEYQIEKRYAEEALINAVQLADKSFASYDNIYNGPLDRALNRFRDAYNTTDGKPEFLDLQELQLELSEFFTDPIDLYIIDSDATVRYSTYETDIGLNFSQTPSFRKKLRSIREGRLIVYDSIITGTIKGEYRKYGYIPTPDHRYVLEIGINLDQRFKKEQISKYRPLAVKFKESIPDVVTLWIFDQSSLTISHIEESIADLEFYPYKFEELPDRREYLIKVFADKKPITIGDLSSSHVIRYIYIPGGKSKTASAGLYDKVAEIIYDTSSLNQKINDAQKLIFVLAVMVISILFIIGYVSSRYITRPVYQIIEDIEIIANGDYDHQIGRTSGFEFRRLELSIQKLVERLKEDIVAISRKSTDLDTELKTRRHVEDALRAANHKLSLMTSITRHDILNRVMITNFYSEELLNALSDPTRIDQVKKIQKASEEIQALIKFTAYYQDLGVTDPCWQDLQKIIESRYIQGLLHSVPISSSLDDLQVYADGMMEKVIYNLVENSFRHGVHLTMIRLSCHQEKEEMVIWYEDDGGGISADEKEKIFEKGFGRNTGLGLFLIREILAITEISITERGESGVGVRFEIRVPAGKWRKHKQEGENNETS